MKLVILWKLFKAVKLPAYIQEVTLSNLGQYTNCPECGFPESVQPNSRNVTYKMDHNHSVPHVSQLINHCHHVIRSYRLYY
jgi:hypothetical protein